MLSILIPTFNYNISPLVNDLFHQCKSSNVNFEIIVLDDSSKLFHNENASINLLDNCSYEVLTKNIGRSAIRNLLAHRAKFDWLIFLDADVTTINKKFISNYLIQIEDKIKIVNGGVQYQHQRPRKEQLFRWVYGTNRESKSPAERDKNVYLSLLTLNFMIHKSIFNLVRFNENIPNLRHEDTLFSYDLMKAQIAIQNIDNAVIHNGLDNFNIALEKENNSLVALKNLLDNNLLDPNYLVFSRYYSKINSLKLDYLFAFFFNISKPLLLYNLSSNVPSMFIFDLYRLGYFCKLNLQ